MTIELWNKLHKGETMTKENTKTVKILRNIGSNDLSRLNLEEAYTEGTVVELHEPIADKLIRQGIAKEYDEAAKKADEEAAKRVHEADIAAALPAAQRELAADEAKEEAKRRAKAGPVKATLPATPTTIGTNPHDPVKKLP